MAGFRVFIGIFEEIAPGNGIERFSPKAEGDVILTVMV